jgi:hypothetical protein
MSSDKIQIQEQTTEIKEPIIEQPIEQQIETQIDLQTEPEIKTKKGKTYIKKGIDSRGRPKTEGKTTAYGLPVDVDYYKKYYADKLAIKVQCEECLMFVAKVNLKKHKISSYHQRFCQQIQNNAIDV